MKHIYLCFLLLFVHDSFGAEIFTITIRGRNETDYKCSDELIVFENEKAHVDIVSKKEVFYAWYIKNGLNRTFSINNQTVRYGDKNYKKGHFIYTDVNGTDYFEGKWQFIFLINKNPPIDSMVDNSSIIVYHDKNTYMQVKCDITIRIYRSIALRLYDEENNILTETTKVNEATVSFNEGMIKQIECVKNYEDGRYLKSGSLFLVYCVKIRKNPNDSNEDSDEDKQDCGTISSLNKSINYTIQDNLLVQSCVCSFTSAGNFDSNVSMAVDYTRTTRRAGYFFRPIASPGRDQRHGITSLRDCLEYSDKSTYRGSVFHQKDGADTYIHCDATLNHYNYYDNLYIHFCPEQNAAVTKCKTKNNKTVDTENYNNELRQQHIYVGFYETNTAEDWDCIFLIEDKNPTCRYKDRNYKRFDCLLKIRPVQRSTAAARLPPANPKTTPMRLSIVHTTTITTISTTTSTNRPFSRHDDEITEGSFDFKPTRANLGDIVKFECSYLSSKHPTFDIKIWTIDETRSLSILGSNSEVNGTTTYTAPYEMTLMQNATVKCIVHCEGAETPCYISMNNLEAGEAQFEEAKGKSYQSFINYGLIGGGFAIILVLVLAIWKACKNTAIEQKQSSNGNYENLTNEPHHPFPRSAKLEETYIVPADCRSSNTNRPDHEMYAQPFVPKLEDLYSKPTPKRGKIGSNTGPLSNTQRIVTEKELNYAEIDLSSIKSRGNGHYANLSNESNYASISKQNYANLAQEAQKAVKKNTGEDYSNVFTNEPYCNSKNNSDDYAEPAYCQVNRK